MKLTKQTIIFGAICAFVGALITLAICVLAYHPQTQGESVKTIVRTDTITNVITIRDTITKERLKPIYTEVLKTDTIKADTILIAERKGYSIPVKTDSINGEIYASVSGVSPSLDSLSYRFNIPTKTITERVEVERVITKKNHLSYGVGVMAGYGFFGKRPEIVGGVFIGYSF